MVKSRSNRLYHIILTILISSTLFLSLMENQEILRDSTRVRSNDSLQNNNFSYSTDNLLIKQSLSYTFHEPIVINNDADLAAIATSGTGSSNNPYVIEGWDIRPINQHGIFVSGTFDHFVIRNCRIITTDLSSYGIIIQSVAFGTATVFNNTCDMNGCGIYVSNSQQVFIINNSFNDNANYGIYISASSYTNAINNTCDRNRYGIYTVNSVNVIVKNNSCVGNTNYGIRLFGSAFSVVTGNTCNENYYGLSITTSDSSVISFNNCSRNELNGLDIGSSLSVLIRNNSCVYNEMYGIYLQSSGSAIVDKNFIGFSKRGLYGYGCTFSTITNNSFVDCEFNILQGSIQDYNSYTVIDNEVNNLPLGYYKNLEDFSISQAHGQIILINCTDGVIGNQTISNLARGVFSFSCNNLIFQNITYNNSKGNEGIYLENSPSSTIMNCVIMNCFYGIYLVQSSSSEIINNTITGNNRGIYPRFSTPIIIKNNTINSNEYGIDIRSSPNSIIKHNSLMNNGIGVFISDSESSIISGNNFTYCGLRIYENYVDKFFTYNVTDNTVNNLPLGYIVNLSSFDINSRWGQLIIINSFNGIVRNQSCIKSSYGITLLHCSNIVVKENLCKNNSEFGILIYNCQNITVYNNSCYNNGIGIYFYRTDYSRILTNYCFNNFNGIETYYSEFLLISDNFCKENSHGINLITTPHSNITGNLLVANAFYGIYSYSRNGFLSFNSFILNNNGLSQAYDDESHNHWTMNYYWPDWDGSGSYIIEGNNSIDESPLTTSDFDDDGLPDYWEYLMCLNLIEDDLYEDKDGDLLTNQEEFLLGLNASNSDTDNDLMEDSWEILMGLDPLSNDAYFDDDNDGLINVDEYSYGLNVSNADTDFDGMPDGWEISMGLNALINDLNGDLDGDQMPNYWEYTMKLDASVNDALDDRDNDGLTNLDEFQQGLDARKSDSDDDGFSDFIEIYHGTDPLNPTDYPMIATEPITTPTTTIDLITTPTTTTNPESYTSTTNQSNNTSLPPNQQTSFIDGLLIVVILFGLSLGVRKKKN